MKRTTLFSILLVGVLAAASFLPTGCKLFDSNPSGPDASASVGTGPTLPVVVGTARSVSFRVVLPGISVIAETPESAPVANIVGGILAQTATTTPTVTFKLILVNVGNASQPTTTLAKTVSVDASGTATANFTGIPALTCIGDVHIAGGTIASVTDFHGAGDLLPNLENIVVLSPKGSKTREDVIAEVVRRIIADQALLAKAVTGFAARVGKVIQGLDMALPSVYQDAITLFADSASLIPAIETGSQTFLVEQTVPTTGGTLLVASATSPLDGLEVQVPAGAFTSGVTVKVSSAEIASHTLGGDFRPVVPVILINTGGQIAGEPLKIKIPISGETNRFIMAFAFDPVTGDIEALPTVAEDARTITVSTMGMKQPGFSASIRPSILGLGHWNLTDLAIIISGEDSSVLDAETYDSEFVPGIDDWQFVNRGSFLAFGGQCAGQSIAAIWYFLEMKKKQGAPSLFNLYDNDGLYDHSGVGKTDGFDLDDSRGIKFASVVHSLLWEHVTKLESFFAETENQDITTFRLFKLALKHTGEPQLVGLWGKNKDNKTVGQALIVYKADASNLYVADPNYPGKTDRAIRYTNGVFGTYISGENADAIAKGDEITYTKIRFLGKKALINFKKLPGEWAKFQSGTIGQGEFLDYVLMTKDDSGNSVPLTAGLRTNKSNLEISAVGPNLLGVPRSYEYYVYRHKDGYSASQTENVTFPLLPGENKIGINTRVLTQDLLSLTSTYRWLGFQWLTIHCDVPPSISAVTPNPLPAAADTSAQTITIDGANFVDKPTIILTWSGETYTVPTAQVTFVSAARLTMSIFLGAASDSWTVRVVNPDGRSSSAVGFQVLEPGSVENPEIETTEVDLGGGVTMTLVAIASGTFTMGSPSDEPERDWADWLPHQVTLTKGFYMGITEVTQAQWLKVMGFWPGRKPSSTYGVGDNYPAYYISWYDAVRFCNKLSADKGLSPCYTTTKISSTIADGDAVVFWETANGYRLPTDAEWEYACRAGTTGMFSWAETYDEAQMKQYCWYGMNARAPYWTEPRAIQQGIQRVGTRLPNAWGLFDMSGNVWELCNDWFENPSARGNQTDPSGPGAGSDRVLRGGGWNTYWWYCRSAIHSQSAPSYRSYFHGFRLVRIIP